MKNKIIFILWFIFNFFVAFIAKQYDRYPEHFMYKFQLYHHNPYIPSFLISFANYDGANYLHIAHSGYKVFEQSFFPLFPLTIRILSTMFGSNYFLPGFFFANICFAFGFYFFQKYLNLIFKENVSWMLLFLLAFPTSFFFNAVYTEGLFFLLVVFSFYFTKTKQYWLVVIVSFFASLTRLAGFLLIIPLLISLIAENKQLILQDVSIKSRMITLFSFLKDHPLWVCMLFSPILGLLTYMVYLYFSFHDLFGFYHSSSIFGVQRSTHLIFLPQVYFRYISIFLKSQHSFTYYIALLEFVTFNFVLVILCYDFLRLWKSKKSVNTFSLLGLNLFSFANLLLPTFAGSLSSMPRYVLLSLSCFVRLGQIQNMVIKILLLVIFAVLHGLLTWLFIQGYFIS